MKIRVSELKKGVEVDMPVEWNIKPVRQCPIKYLKDIDRFVLADIKTRKVHTMFTRLTDLIQYTNNRYNYKDVAVEDGEN